jgi:large subunit ribosomal protein L33
MLRILVLEFCKQNSRILTKIVVFLWFTKERIMASKKTAVELVALQCSECKRRNYTTKKNRRNTQEKLEFNKYCPFDRKHTLHKETKIK